MKIVVASSNAGKINEFQRILIPLGYDIISSEDAGISLDGVVEDGLTFLDNALIKARFAHAKTGLVSVADDSGLCIDALPDILGVHSARYLPGQSYAEKNEQILKHMVSMSNRQARFVCAIAVVGLDQDHSFQAAVEGHIAPNIMGKEGFGYDPIFIAQGHERSFALMSAEEKNEISHRGQALRKMAAYFKENSYAT